jgi:hypothetical protein
MSGAKRRTEAMGLRLNVVGRGAYRASGSTTGRTCGLHGSENVGMSNERKVRILPVENPRFPGEGSSAQGQSGPKARLVSVVDG